MRRTALLFLLVVAGLAAAVFWLTNRTADDAPLDTSVAVADAMAGSDTSGYARADQVIDFSFPEDHGPHPAFKTEWWYITGNLDTEGAMPTAAAATSTHARARL